MSIVRVAQAILFSQFFDRTRFVSYILEGSRYVMEALATSCCW